MIQLLITCLSVSYIHNYVPNGAIGAKFGVLGSATPGLELIGAIHTFRLIYLTLTYM